MEFVTPRFSKTQVRNAGKLIGNDRGTAAEQEEARLILGNFRSAHAYPLNSVTVTVRKKALEVDKNAVVAQRLKRLPTVLDKLKRHPNMQVTTMQDLGGCRVIYDDINDIVTLVDQLLNIKKAKNKIIRAYDYIHASPQSESPLFHEKIGPKESGYRGIHLVYEYNGSKEDYQGLSIELQVRTQMQHSWATAVETMDLFSKSELKYSKGDPQVIRFFAIVSSLMAIEENKAPVPGADASVDVLIEELREIENQHGIVSRLQSYSAIVGDHATNDRRNALTLELFRSEKELTGRQPVAGRFAGYSQGRRPGFRY